MPDVSGGVAGPAHTPMDQSMLFHNAEAGPSRPRPVGRTSSKSISSRPSLSLNTRTPSYSGSALSPAAHAASKPRSPMSPTQYDGVGVGAKSRVGLKRRISTPLVSNLQLVDEDQPTQVNIPGEPGASAGTISSPVVYPILDQHSRSQTPAAPEAKSRGRSTSTSVVVPSSLLLEEDAAPTIPVLPPVSANHFAQPARLPISRPVKLDIALPKPTLTFTSPSPDDEPLSLRKLPLPERSEMDRTQPKSFLDRVYNTTESALSRVASLVRPRSSLSAPPAERSSFAMHRRGSDDESEKGLMREDTTDSLASTCTRTSSDSLSLAGPSRAAGRYWGLWSSKEKDSRSLTEEEQDGYFSLPPTPPEQDPSAPSDEFESALLEINGKIASLPTPALSAHSLSRSTGRQTSPERSRIKGRTRDGDGWLRGVLATWISGSGIGQGRTRKVIRDLGWTVGILITGFFVSLGMAFWLLKSLPITTLRHLPKSTTDVQLLSAEIRAYMASGDIGWWHTVGVLTFVGCWKHAWSVPGAIVLNILVGSLMSPLPALLLLTIITATGSLASYLLSRPLAPLIAVLFPKPLSLVRAALAPEVSSLATGSHSSASAASIHDASETFGQSLSAPCPQKPNVWRRLLIMRAMGFVPWSGMNVACGVVGVDWKIFWLTTAAGSASWSYTTASIGDLLARLAVPSASASAAVSDIGASGSDLAAEMQGESLTAMLRDPVLIAKMVFLTALTLIPVFLKRSSSAKSMRTPASGPTDQVGVGGVDEKSTFESHGPDESASISPVSPRSPISRSFATFTPTPEMFDLLSFGRTAARTTVGVVVSGGRHVGLALGRMMGR